MQNAPAASGMLPDDFRTKQKVLPPKRVLGPQAGCGDVTSLYKNLVKNRKLTFAGRRFKSPFFLWLIQILKAVTMGVVAACGTFLAR
jgi:hypothetical protein